MIKLESTANDNSTGDNIEAELSEMGCSFGPVESLGNDSSDSEEGN